jgi:hypothetical protein
MIRNQMWRRWAGTVAFVAVVVSFTTAVGSPANAIPPPDDPACLANTVVNSMSVNRRSTIGAAGLDRVRFSWNLTKGCPNLDLRVDGQRVGAVGSMDVTVSASRRLSVRGQVLGCCSATWHGPFVLAGRFIRYSERADGSLAPGQAQPRSGSAVVDAAAREVVESLRPAYRDRFAGRRIEIHVLPQGHAFTELPPWDEEGANGDAYGLGSAADDLYQDDDGLWGPGRYVHSIGITAGSGAHTVTHELGHAVLFHTDDDLVTDNGIAWVAHGWCPGGEGCNPTAPEPEWVGCLGGDDYGATNPHEYWAEGTAALFEVGGQCPFSPVPPQPDPNQYTQDYLFDIDPQLGEVLRRVFDA